MAFKTYSKPSKKTTRVITKAKIDLKKAASESSPQNKKKQKSWNDMSHLSIKRFHDNDPSLTQGAKCDRSKKPYVACAQIDPSGRSKCKLCGDLIPKGTLRLCLMMECHKGYRHPCTLHPVCFWQHPETRKLDSADEIAILNGGVSEQDVVAVRTHFECLQQSKKKEGEEKAE